MLMVEYWIKNDLFLSNFYDKLENTHRMPAHSMLMCFVGQFCGQRYNIENALK